MSKKTFFLSLWFCSFIFIGHNFTFANEYVPWVKGDTATYIDSLNGIVNVEIDRENANWRHYNNFAGLGPQWVWTNTGDERVFIWNPAKKRKQLLVDFDGPIGSAATINVQPCNIGSAIIIARDETIETQAGKFNDVIQLDLESSCADGGVTNVWFAKGVGVVKWTSMTIIGPNSAEMISGSIQGSAYPQGLIVSAAFPETIAAIDMEPPVNIDRPPTVLRAALTVKNNTERDLTFRFNSGQQFDIMIIDSEGNIVSTWSRGRAFTEALVHLTLAGGKSLNFSGSVELTDDEGNALPAGSYTIKIEMTSAPNQDTDHSAGSARVSASSPLAIWHAL